ncbi:hypothetical protein [Anaerovibrio sp. RM50]|uniref:hypothetical protein n=1 Tax=Anaerovibrio sp. RM50 TaxID=1200557 RepID=UPI000480A12B|nr:hypothetical protein [Anaerovibrio sp. RM50]
MNTVYPSFYKDFSCIASDYSLDDLLIYTDISTEYIFIAAAITGDLSEAIRRWSEQIEYCPENVAMLLKM